MDDIVAKSEISLYEADFYAWTREQARLLKSARLDRIDIANIVEEIESLGRYAGLGAALAFESPGHHLLKEIFQPERASRSWAVTIVVQRQDLERHLMENPSLKPRTSKIFAQSYADARKVAAAETGIRLKSFPKDPPFSFAQAMDESFWPGRSIDDRA